MPPRIFVSIALSLFLGFTHHWICIHSGQKLQSESKNNRIWCETSEQLQSISLNSFSIETHELIHSTAVSRLFLVLCILKLLIRIERNFIQSGQRLTFRTFDGFWTHAARFNAFQQYFFSFHTRNCFEFNSDYLLLSNFTAIIQFALSTNWQLFSCTRVIAQWTNIVIWETRQ